MSGTATSQSLVVPSPVGPLTLVAAEGRISQLRFAADGADDATRAAPSQQAPGPELQAAATQLAEYFAGARREFNLPLAQPRSEFDRRVLAGVFRIPYGETTSYGQLAATLGLEAADARAVGSANARNPLPILVSCHRVLGADGSLTGYLGGPERKQALLDLEAPQQPLA